MYDQSSREFLHECAFYESYLIREILEVQELAIGRVSDTHYTIPDEGPTNLSFKINDSLGASHSAEFSSKLAPLVMASAFKILDRIWEWILAENSKKPNGPFWSFRAKYNCFTTERLVFPDFLAGDTAFQDVLKGLYIFFWPRRNAIVHSGWGTLLGQDLKFDFEYPDVTQLARPTVLVNDTLRFKDTVAFADFTQQLLEMFHKTSRQSNDRLAVLKILADKLANFHKAKVFGENQRKIFRVHRITGQSKISIRDIRKRLEPSISNQPYYFILTITENTKNETWEVFSEDLPDSDEISLEELKQKAIKI
jgi:hypothetical protein